MYINLWSIVMSLKIPNFFSFSDVFRDKTIDDRLMYPNYNKQNYPLYLCVGRISGVAAKHMMIIVHRKRGSRRCVLRRYRCRAAHQHTRRAYANIGGVIIGYWVRRRRSDHCVVRMVDSVRRVVATTAHWGGMVAQRALVVRVVVVHGGGVQRDHGAAGRDGHRGWRRE